MMGRINCGDCRQLLLVGWGIWLRSVMATRDRPRGCRGLWWTQRVSVLVDSLEYSHCRVVALAELRSEVRSFGAMHAMSERLQRL